MTELIWDGKYKDGKKVAPVKISLPFQTIETVNESAQERQRTLDLFSTGRDPEWRNRLIWGDKKYVLPSLLQEFAGKVNLVYIDPPFDTGANFSFTATIPDNPETEEDESASFIKEPSMIEQKAYRDTWGKGLDSYLEWFYETTVLLKDLLAEDGCIYVHLDWHVGYYAKVILDEVFGSERFINEIIWKRRGGALNNFKSFGSLTDSLFLYSKSENYYFKALRTKESDEAKQYIAERFIYDDGDGRKYSRDPVTNPASTPTSSLIYEYKGYKPPEKGWAFSKKTMEKWDKEGKLYFPSDKNQRIRRKTFLSEYEGQPIQNLWTDIYVINSQAKEFVGYLTQKPESLLERVMKISSREGDLILDCFCGSGTTPAVTEKLNRRWIACDLGRFAIHTTRKRLLSIPNVKPFVVQNLGKYERQAWQVAEFEEPKDHVEKELKYRKFILDLYKAQPVTGYAWLHGLKNSRMVYVGSVDAPVTVADVKSIAAEVWKAVGKGKDSAREAAVDILGWDFALEVNEVAKQMAAQANVDVAFKVIPREVLEKKAVEQGDIRFFELASVSVKIQTNGLEAKVKLSDVVIPPQDVPAEVQKAITHWSQWVDYWAIDWDYKNDTFHNQWQSYRTRKNSKIDLETSHVYEAPGEYQVMVKVIDILGNDTTKLATVKVTSAHKKSQEAKAAARD